jgi:hypothetical protein
MNHDPLNDLRRRNPVPPESLPEAPMAVAKRITARRPSLGHGLAIAATAAAVVLLAGGGWLIWTRTGGHRAVVAPTTTTTIPATTTSASTTTSVPTGGEAETTVVYFLDGDSLVAVSRDLSVLDVRPLPDLGPLTLDLLLWGPGPWSTAPLEDPVAAADATLRTAIPQGTEVLGLTVDGGVAELDLSAEFSNAPAAALAQVVFTLTRLDGVDAVHFLVEGVPQSVTSPYLDLYPPHLVPVGTSATGGGPGVVDPVTRLTFEYYMPPAMLEDPALGGTLTLPGTVTGTAHPTDWRVLVTVRDAAGTTIWEGPAQVTCGTPWSTCRRDQDWSTFTASVSTTVPYAQWGTVMASIDDAEGTPFALRNDPVWLTPGGTLPSVSLAPPEPTDLLIQGTHAPYTLEETQAFGEFGPLLWGLVTTLNSTDAIPHDSGYQSVTWGPLWGGHLPVEGPNEVYGITDLAGVDTEAIAAVVPVGTTISFRQVRWSLDQLDQFRDDLRAAFPDNLVCSVGSGLDRLEITALRGFDPGSVPPDALVVEIIDECPTYWGGTPIITDQTLP